jgi:hypothetical protein
MIHDTGCRKPEAGPSGIAATPTHPLASKAGDLRPDSGSRIHGPVIQQDTKPERKSGEKAVSR